MVKRPQWLKTLNIRLIPHSRSKAQSLVELALVLPIMILMLLGIAEVALFMGRYLDVLDLTREAARLASLNDPTVVIASPSKNCSDADPQNIDYYYRVACVFSPPKVDSTCADSNFCDGFNRYINFDL
ncbi:MAG: pilus assembly protein, partial [Anaerolineae bacterium]|nr:pilus assembly protein [Anaerolineae bacterium]